MCIWSRENCASIRPHISRIYCFHSWLCDVISRELTWRILWIEHLRWKCFLYNSVRILCCIDPNHSWSICVSLTIQNVTWLSFSTLYCIFCICGYTSSIFWHNSSSVLISADTIACGGASSIKNILRNSLYYIIINHLSNIWKNSE